VTGYSADQKEPAMSETSPSPLAAEADDSVVMTTRELMEFLSLSRTKIWELTKKEGLPATKVGGDYRYVRSEVLAWLEKFRVDRS
jgi:excisionase family DNA binding protein